jgi:asparagine N-glycosylation enzyme membrane subunit Stt3
MKNNDSIKPILEIISNKKYQWIAVLLILFAVLMMSSSIRLSNWELLTDSVTGEKLPLALDPYYFLRISETIVETNGNLPEFDEMRVHGFDTAWSSEIMPRVVVWMWKMSSFFGDYTLKEVNAFSPVLFFAIGLVLFFILVYVLTNSKFAAVLASAFLAFTPAYLYRTMAGFSDHEAIGMVGFFLVMFGLVLALKYLDAMKKRNLIGAGVAGLAVGALSVLTALCWSGVTTFVFMIISIAFAMLWVIRLKDEDNNVKDNGLLFYLVWIVSSVGLAVLFGMDFYGFVSRFITGSTGIISLAVLGFIVIDRIVLSFGKLIKTYDKKYRIWYSAGISAALGIIILPLIGKSFFNVLWVILNRLLNPSWGGSRVGSTVAENAQPYLVNWIGTAGSQIFWLFVAGMFLIGIEFSKNIRSRKNRYLLIFGYAAIVSGILFSRISAGSVLNGNGIFSLSGLVYLGGITIFGYAFFRNYFDREIKVDSSILILFAWMIVMLVIGRSTTRLFFVIAPFMCLSAAYFIVKMIDHFKKGKLEEISKILVIGILIISIVAGSIAIYGSYNAISAQARYTGPSANEQWQNAMGWVKENTTETAVFSHWWDYGYWVQTLGERITVADGGHGQSIYDGDHKIGRYVLTTPRPETALSFFKTMDVDYLLIDQTDLGKYPAYSKIGGGNDENGDTSDRYAAIPVMPSDPKQTRETAKGTMIVFNGGMYLFEDINYDNNGTNVFLPAGEAAVIATIVNVENNRLMQPEAIYSLKNGAQPRIPIRYAYVNGDLVDFGSGLDAVIFIIPSFTEGGVNPLGAAVYLSQKVSKSLFARLFLMDDAFEEYGTLELVHTEDDPVVASLRSQGVSIGDFVYYKGFRGPIKIWDTSSIPEGIKVVEEFKEPAVGEYGTLDDLDFGFR